VHEKHQVEKIVQEAIVLAAAKNATGVRKVWLVIGDLLGFDEMSVRMYFELMAESTILEGAELEIVWARGQLNCPACEKNFEKKGSDLNCPDCGKQGTPTEIGKEFYIEDIETE
jgi:hydrogenase nickel incorporation protein HypA/HybF